MSEGLDNPGLRRQACTTRRSPGPLTSRSAGLLLADLLREPGKARKIWVAKTDRWRQQGISYAAVAQVLAEYLWDSGEINESVQNLPRQLRDRVRRAFLGQHMTRTTLTQLMNAFELGDADRQRLDDAFNELDKPGDHVTDPQAEGLPVRQRHRSLSITEHHYLGADRCPKRHVTTQVLQGSGEPYSSYLYMFDTNTIAVTGKQGIREVGPIRAIADGVFGVDIVLLRPLTDGETTTVTYESLFSYSEPPEPEFRRAAFEGVESLDIRVGFDEAAVPSDIVFAEWDQLSHHEPSTEHAARLEDDLSVHRFLRSVDNSIVGFRWQW